MSQLLRIRALTSSATMANKRVLLTAIARSVRKVRRLPFRSLAVIKVRQAAIGRTNSGKDSSDTHPSQFVIGVLK
jgi:hypothetical protein